MVSNDDFDGKATHLNYFYMHMNFEQKYPKLAKVYLGSQFDFTLQQAEVLCSVDSFILRAMFITYLVYMKRYIFHIRPKNLKETLFSHV